MRKKETARRAGSLWAYAATAAIAVAAIAGVQAPARADGRSAVVRVDGLTCPFCAYGIEKKFRDLPGVAGVVVRMRAGEVVVRYAEGAEPDAEALRRAVVAAGFSPREVRGIETGAAGTGGETAAGRPSPAGTEAGVGAARSPDGTLYIAEPGAGRIVATAPSGETRVVAEGLDRPMHIALADGRIYVPEFGAGRVAVLDATSGARLATLGAGALEAPAGVAVGPAGLGGTAVYVADFYAHRVVVLSETGVVRTIGRKGHGPADLFYPTDVAVGPDGPGGAALYVADAYNHRVQVFSPDGRHVRTIGREGSGPGEFRIPEGLDIAADGAVLVADAENGRVAVFGADGRYRGAWTGLEYPVEVVTDGAGGGWAVLVHAGEVRRLGREDLR